MLLAEPDGTVVVCWRLAVERLCRSELGPSGDRRVLRKDRVGRGPGFWGDGSVGLRREPTRLAESDSAVVVGWELAVDRLCRSEHGPRTIGGGGARRMP